MLEKIFEKYLKFNDWYCRFFFKDHKIITSFLIGYASGTILVKVLDICSGLISKLRSKH